MKRISSLVLAAVLLIAPEIATAKDFCLEVGNQSEIVFKNFSAPGKGTCKFIVELNATIPGIATGGACTTSDGSELQYSVTDGIFDAIEIIQGSTPLTPGSTGILSVCQAVDAWRDELPPL